MIALPLPVRLPSLQIGTQKIPNYNQDWLEASIHHAAAEAGHEQWWLAEDIAKSVFLYLRDRFKGNIITLADVFRKTSVALEAIGFVEIADKLEIKAPPARICLLNLVSEAGAAYELGFFRLLGDRIGELQQAGAPTISLTGLNPCVRQLRCADSWCPECEALQEEILEHASLILQARSSGESERTATLLVR